MTKISASSSGLKAFRSLAVVMGAALIMAACAPAATPVPTAVPTTVPPTAAPAATVAPTAAAAGGMDALVAAAKSEGQLTYIARPHDWDDNAGTMDRFQTMQALTVNR